MTQKCVQTNEQIRDFRFSPIHVQLLQLAADQVLLDLQNALQDALRLFSAQLCTDLEDDPQRALVRAARA